MVSCMHEERERSIPHANNLLLHIISFSYYPLNRSSFHFIIQCVLTPFDSPIYSFGGGIIKLRIMYQFTVLHTMERGRLHCPKKHFCKVYFY